MLDRIIVYEGTHARDGLVMQAWDEDKLIDVFMGREAMDHWPKTAASVHLAPQWGAAEYKAFGNQNIDAIARIVATKYEGRCITEPSAYVEVLTSDVDADSVTLSNGDSPPPTDQHLTVGKTHSSYRQHHVWGALTRPLAGVAKSNSRYRRRS
jgi:hypothetical protein